MITQRLIQQLPAAAIDIDLSEGNRELDLISLQVGFGISAAASVQVRVTITDTQGGVTVWETTEEYTASGATTITISCAPDAAKAGPHATLGQGIVIPIPKRIRGGDSIRVAAAVTAGAATTDAAVLRYIGNGE